MLIYFLKTTRSMFTSWLLNTSNDWMDLLFLWMPIHMLSINILADIYLLKINNRNTKTKCKIYSKLTIQTPKRRHLYSSVSFVDFEQVNTGWDDLYGSIQIWHCWFNSRNYFWYSQVHLTTNSKMDRINLMYLRLSNHMQKITSDLNSFLRYS